tara:strand:+ start:608 stop:817 length:210 start_codon:yes stop_codon:yes gene_type:complete
MCLGGGGGGYEYKEPKKKVWESEFTAPPDTVNNKLLTAGGDYSQEATKHLSPKKAKLKTPTKQSEKIVS